MVQVNLIYLGKKSKNTAVELTAGKACLIKSHKQCHLVLIIFL